MQRGQEINRQELCIGTSTMSNQRSRKRSSEEIYYSASEELEMFAEQAGQVPTKRRREEEKGSYAKQAGQVPTKRRREEEKGSYAKQAGQTPRKRSRKEEEGSSDEQAGQTPRKRIRYYTASEDLQSCAERKGEKRRWSQDTECESHLSKRRRSGGGANGGTAEQVVPPIGQTAAPTERVEAPTGQAAAPTGQAAAHTEQAAAPTGQAAAPTGQAAAHTGQAAAPTEQAAAPTGQAAAHTEQAAAPTGQAAAPTGQAAAHTEQEVAPTGQAAAPTRQEESDLTPESFIFHKILGAGAFGTVALATHIDSGVLVAVKIVDKMLLIAGSSETAQVERLALEKVGGSHYCTHAYATFQTESQLFYVMEYLSGGDLVDKEETCDITTLRLATAELVCGLEFIHSKGIIHRDLKLDNVLIDSTGHIKIADFGIAAIYTPERKMSSDPSMDYFWLGVSLCDLAFGCRPTFCNRDNIMYCVMPKYLGETDPDLMHLLEKLLCEGKEVRKATISNIRKHPFFRGINWEEVEARETRPPFFVRRKGLRQVTKQKIPLYCLLNNDNVPDKKQVLFDGFSFESDQWRAMQKLN